MARYSVTDLPHQRADRGKSAYRNLKVGDLVRATGAPLAFVAEIDVIERNIDHFWITLGIGGGELLRIALSTYSRQNAAGGFDPRVRIGIIESIWRQLPIAGVALSPGLNYQEIEEAAAIPPVFESYERPKIEALLTDKSSRAILIEVWGEFYLRSGPGIHQVHSRRASCSVLRDLKGRDGAIRFYFESDTRAEMLLFKYCGQP